MFTTCDKYTMEEIVRMNEPGMPGAAGNLWQALEIMAREIDAMERIIRSMKEPNT